MRAAGGFTASPSKHFSLGAKLMALPSVAALLRLNLTYCLRRPFKT